MTDRYGQDWCDTLAGAVGAAGLAGTERVLFVVTDTDVGKAAFVLETNDGGLVTASEGRLPRGVKAAVTVTIKEERLVPLFAGERSWDAAFMRGDIKVEGDYEQWLDGLVPLFQADPWASAWKASVG